MNDRFPPDNERALLDGCLARDEDVWKAFLDRYARLLYGAILSTLRRYGVHAGIEQSEEIFCGLMEHFVADDCRVLRTFDARGGCKLSSWLNVLAVNYAVDVLRDRVASSHRSEVPLAETLGRDLETSGGNPERELGERESRALLEACLADLSVKEKLFARLYYRDGFEVARIAKLLRLTESSVYALRERLLSKLRGRLSRASSS